MLMPSIFGENLFNDDWMNFGFPEVEKALYGKHASHEMKTDVRETDSGYEVDIDLPGFKKDEINIQLDNGYLSISAAKGLDMFVSLQYGLFGRVRMHRLLST